MHTIFHKLAYLSWNNRQYTLVYAWYQYETSVEIENKKLSDKSQMHLHLRLYNQSSLK
jgi:hypothetical protein